jgi:hypothetical protein
MRTGLAAALSYFAETADWTGFDAVQARQEESRLAWTDAWPPARGEISVRYHSGQELLLVGLSASGTYFCLAQVPASPATESGRGPDPASVDQVSKCTGGW